MKLSILIILGFCAFASTAPSSLSTVDESVNFDIFDNIDIYDIVERVINQVHYIVNLSTDQFAVHIKQLTTEVEEVVRTEQDRFEQDLDNVENKIKAGKNAKCVEEARNKVTPLVVNARKQIESCGVVEIENMSLVKAEITRSTGAILYQLDIGLNNLQECKKITNKEKERECALEKYNEGKNALPELIIEVGVTSSASYWVVSTVVQNSFSCASAVFNNSHNEFQKIVNDFDKCSA